jgi:carbon storage regulator
MLVFTRKIDESFIITTPDGTRLTVTILDIRGDKVRLGIAAPEDYSIHREEVQNRIDNGEKERRS